MAHFVLTYDLSPDYLARRGAFRTEHLAQAWAAADAGTLLLGGAVGDPPDEALLIFTDAAAAEAFARADCYVTNGLVTGWRVRPWATVIGDGAATPVRPDA
jgi:uncharacterized protein